MKAKQRIENPVIEVTTIERRIRLEPFLKRILLGVLFSVLCASGGASAQQKTQPKPAVSPEQQQRLDLMKSKGPEASMTILPVRLGGRPFDRAPEVVGWVLEQAGLKNIELGKTAFDPGKETDMARLAGSLLGRNQGDPPGSSGVQGGDA